MKGKSLTLPQQKKLGEESKQEKDRNTILENGMQSDEVLAFSPQPSVWEGEEETSAEPETIVANEATGHARQGKG